MRPYDDQERSQSVMKVGFLQWPYLISQVRSTVGHAKMLHPLHFDKRPIAQIITSYWSLEFCRSISFGRWCYHKILRSQSEEDMQPIIREAISYDILGTHPRIAVWLSRSEYIDISTIYMATLQNIARRARSLPSFDLNGSSKSWKQLLLFTAIVCYSFGSCPTAVFHWW